MTALGDVYKPFPKQFEFHQAALDPNIRYVCFWGALDSGKTFAGAAEACRQAFNRPGGTGWIIRQTYRELQDSTAKQFREHFLIPLGMELKYTKRDESIIVRAKGGKTSTILLRSLDHPEKFRSAQTDWIWMDEASDPKIKSDAFNLLRGRMRDAVNPIFILTTNPPFVGQWLYNYFHKPKPPFFTVFVQTFDNPYHDKEYVADLLASYPQDWVEVYLMGKAGMILAGEPVYRGAFTRERNVLPFDFSPGIKLLRGWDFGVVRAAVVWAQIETLKDANDSFVDHSVEHLHYIDEAVYEGLAADEIARMVKARTLRKFPKIQPSMIMDACDVAGNQRSQATASTAINELRRQGIYPYSQLLPSKEEAILDFSKNLRTESHNRPLILFTPNCSVLTTAMDAGFHRNETGEIVNDGLYIHVADAALYLHAAFFSSPAFRARRPRKPRISRAIYDFTQPSRKRDPSKRYAFR